MEPAFCRPGAVLKKERLLCSLLCLNFQEKPEGFKDYQRQSGSVGIVSMLHQIIGDAKIMETKARVDD